MTNKSLSDEVGTTLQAVTRLQRRYASAQNFRLAHERTEYFDARLRGLHVELKALRSAVHILQMIFHDPSGKKAWHQLQLRLQQSQPLQALKIPGVVLESGSLDLLLIVERLAVATTLVGLQIETCMDLIIQHLQSRQAVSQRRGKAASQDFLKNRLDQLLHELADQEESTWPSSRRRLLAQLETITPSVRSKV